MLSESHWKDVPCDDFNDLYRYLRPYRIPLDTHSILSKLGSIIREYLYTRIEFKVNCRIGMNDRLISSCISLLPLNNASVASCSNQKKKPKYKHCCTDFYAAFNVRRAQSWNEPNAVLFQYPQYTKSALDENIRGTKLDFLAQKQLKYMVLAAPNACKPNIRRKRRGSAQPPSTLSPHKRKPMIRQVSHNAHHTTNIPSNTAIIYPQDNILWSYFESKPKVLDQNAWLPIVSLWRQNEAHIVYMLRGSNERIPKLSVSNPKKKRRKRSNSAHVRIATSSEPIPALSPLDQSVSLHSISKQCRKRKHKKAHISDTTKNRVRSSSLHNIENEEKNPCKLYEIKITPNQVCCTNVFDFPHVNIQHELTWFDVETRSLLLIVHKRKSISLQVIRQNRSAKRSTAIPQSTTTNVCTSIPEEAAFKNKKRNGSKRKMSASELFHMKLENESRRTDIRTPPAYAHWFRDCRCLKLFHHKDSNAFVLLIQKASKHGVRTLLLKLRINFMTTKIESMSFGIVDDKLFMGASYNIVGYDYNRSLLIVDTLYEPLVPLHSHVLQKGIRSSSSGDIYKQYNKWFSFASKKFVKTKTKVITKKFACVPLNDFVCHWTNIYDS